MSNEDNDSDSFTEFKGKPDPVEEGFTTGEMITGFGFFVIIIGFVLGLIRLIGLNGGETPADYETHTEQMYLSYLIMFVGMLMTSFAGFGGMFKKTVNSFISSEK